MLPSEVKRKCNTAIECITESQEIYGNEESSLLAHAIKLLREIRDAAPYNVASAEARQAHSQYCGGPGTHTDPNEAKFWHLES